MVGRGKEGTRDSSERVARLGGGFFRLRAAISDQLASTCRGRFLPPEAGRKPARAPYHLDTEMAEYERTPRVLVVEDDDAIAQVLQRSLRMEGYEVRIAGDGTTALDEAHGFLPDLLILDLGLPGPRRRRGGQDAPPGRR